LIIVFSPVTNYNLKKKTALISKFNHGNRMAKDLNDHTIILFPMLLVQMDSVVVNHVLFIRIFFLYL
jgi:hypothetical protein